MAVAANEVSIFREALERRINRRRSEQRRFSNLTALAFIFPENVHAAAELN
jgi:hypothetical protein